MLSYQRMISGFLLLGTAAFGVVVSFSPNNTPMTAARLKVVHGPSSWLTAYRDGSDGESFRDALSLNKARTDIRNFLTQRALQSFIFLLISCRDEATVHWLETKCDCKNIDNFHGTGAFNLTKYPKWSSILVELLFEPADVVIVRKSLGRTRGMSKNNPYAEERYVDFEIDIDPPGLVSRIVSVRDQIAGEWVADLDTLKVANEMILESYYETQEAQRTEEVMAEKAKAEKVKADMDTALAQNFEANRLEDLELTIKVILDFLAKDESTLVSDSVKQSEAQNLPSPSVTAEDENGFSGEFDDDEECLAYDDTSDDCVETASLTAPYSDTGLSYEQKLHAQTQKKAYDRTAMIVIGSNIVQDGRVSSPYRKSSFDLLGLLATQESIHRVLRQYRLAGEEREVSYAWFREFYVSRVAQYFDGSQSYGRADDFLEALLLTAPAMKEMDGKLGLIDPLRIAEDVIAMRSEVAQDWKDIIVDVPTQDHTELRKLILAIQMGKSVEETSLAVEEEEPVNFEDEFQ